MKSRRINCLPLLMTIFLLAIPFVANAQLNDAPYSVVLEQFGGLPVPYLEDVDYCQHWDRTTLTKNVLSRELICGKDSSDSQKGRVRYSCSRILALEDFATLVVLIKDAVTSESKSLFTAESIDFNTHDDTSFHLRIVGNNKTIDLTRFRRNSKLELATSVFVDWLENKSCLLKKVS